MWTCNVGSGPGLHATRSVLRHLRQSNCLRSQRQAEQPSTCTTCTCRGAKSVRRAACGVRARHSARSTGVSAATARVWSSSHTWPVLAALGARSSQRTTHTVLTAALGASPARIPGFTTRRSECPPEARTAAAASTAHRRCYRVNQAESTCRWAGWAAGIGQRRSETGNFEYFDFGATILRVAPDSTSSSEALIHNPANHLQKQIAEVLLMHFLILYCTVSCGCCTWSG